MKKKKTLLLALGIFFLFLSGCSQKNEATQKGTNQISESNIKNQVVEPGFKLWVITDIHYISPSLYDDGEKFKFIIQTSAGKDIIYQEETLEALVYKAQHEKPNVLVVSGDLTLNGEKQSAIELAVYFAEIEKTGTNVYVIPGNHDISDGWAKKYRAEKAEETDQILPKDFSRIFQDFGYNEAISVDSNSLSYLVAPRENLWIAMIDTNKYSWQGSTRGPITSGSLRDETYQWLQECFTLAAEKGAKVIPVIHHNLLDHNQLVNQGFTLDNAEEIQKLLSQEKVSFTLSGHIHAQDIASKQLSGEPIYDIVTGSFAMLSNPIGELTFENGQMEYQRISTDVDIWAQATKNKNPDLLNHNEYLRTLMQKDGEAFAISQIYEEQWPDKSQAESIGKFVGEANIRFFGGQSFVEKAEMEKVTRELEQNPAYQALQKQPKSSLTSYIESIYIDQDTNNIQLKIPFQFLK
ncbi:metallophosphoesterase [Carnobacterium maltaromaticum]|uniref:metallophosphoesterase n=1 Tax=Carnobacterium maltaromaticum TaxID=2751 RepID=UPI001D1BBFF8|nr:metallophosphoesterase [Carnobacterium maltaromaticum]MCC4310943.1 calcineurin [Carnobacterium maltaromaticum]